MKSSGDPICLRTDDYSLLQLATAIVAEKLKTENVHHASKEITDKINEKHTIVVR